MQRLHTSKKFDLTNEYRGQTTRMTADEEKRATTATMTTSTRVSAVLA